MIPSSSATCCLTFGWLSQLYFRAEVHGFENVPDEPVLFVGNHSGGANTPDTFVFTLAYHTFMTVEGRPLVALAHQVVVRIPVIGDIARKYGMVQAGQSAAAEFLARGRQRARLPGRRRRGVAALEGPQQDRVRRSERLPQAGPRARVKIVPVVAVGGQETFFVLNDGRKMAKLLRFDKLFRVKSLPLSVSIPWGLLPGDLPHIPFPAKIRMQVLPPIDLRELFGGDPDWDQAYGYVTSVMQVALSSLAAKTVIPVLG